MNEFENVVSRTTKTGDVYSRPSSVVAESVDKVKWIMINVYTLCVGRSQERFLNHKLMDIDLKAFRLFLFLCVVVFLFVCVPISIYQNTAKSL